MSILTEHTKNLVNAFGFLDEGEAELLQKLSELVPKNGVCVNIGAGVGTSSLAVLEKRPDLTDTFFTIDITKEGNPFGGLGNERNAFDKVGMKYPHQIHGDSKHIVTEWEREIDFLIIDGDHSYEGAKTDIEEWGKFLKAGGIILVHDYGSVHWSAVKEVVDKYLHANTDYVYLDEINTYIAFKKKE